MMPSDKDIAYALENMSGISGYLFAHQQAFDRVITPLIENYKTPLKEAVEVIKRRLINSVENCCRGVFDDSYTLLEEKVKKVISDNIGEFGQDTTDHLMAHIDAQMAYMNLEHQMFKAFCNQKQSEIGAMSPINDIEPNGNDQNEASNHQAEKSSKFLGFKSKGKKDSKKVYNGSMEHLIGDVISIASLEDYYNEKFANPIATNPLSLKSLVLCYMEIVHTTIKDMTPKYLVLKLIQRVSNF